MDAMVPVIFNFRLVLSGFDILEIDEFKAPLTIDEFKAQSSLISSCKLSRFLSLESELIVVVWSLTDRSIVKLEFLEFKRRKFNKQNKKIKKFPRKISNHCFISNSFLEVSK
jgi:hypothetical protein